MMNTGSIVFLVAVFVVDRFIQKRFPLFYERIQLPINVILSILVAIYCCFMVYGVYDVLTSSVSTGDKIFFVIFAGIIITIYIVMAVIEWKRWLSKRK